LLPSLALIDDIEVAGPGQVRALMMVGANPSLSSTGSGPRYDAALQKLELFFALDLYVNESNRFAHYVLPVTGMYEREDVPLISINNMLRPSLFATAPVIEPVGEAREEWEVFYDIGRRMGYGDAFATTPRDIIDQVIRSSSVGDRFGENPAGVTFQTLIDQYPNGYPVAEELPTGVMKAMLATPDKRINLAPDELLSELARLHEDALADDSRYPLRLVGLREALSHNTWMHNAPGLMTTSREHYARVNPGDAAARGITEGTQVRIHSPHGEVEIKAHLTAEMSPGNVALPHGWGHKGGWQRANSVGGANSNRLASDDPADCERIAGMSVLNGIPIELTAV
ncbi:MAG: molybdopterin dinucleotide binding domain-containing protein, partial [Steroidobacteraceae bacterium]